MTVKNNHAVLSIRGNIFFFNFYFNSEILAVFNRIFNRIFTVQHI